MNTIDSLLTVAQKRLAELEGEAEHLRALIRLYAGSAQGQNAKQAPAASDAKGRNRGVSPAWKPLGAHLASHGELHLNDLEAFAVQNGLNYTRVQIRNQMHNWKRSGFIESPQQSVFAVTHAGVAEMSDDAPSNSNGADHEPAPSPITEGSDEPRSYPARLDLPNTDEAPLPGGGT